MVDILRRPFSWLKFLQLAGGFVCFGLYMNYYGEISRAVVAGAENSNEAFVRNTFTTTGIVAFPFIIVLLTIITMCVNGESVETHLLCYLLNFVGFGMYLTIGSLIAHYSSEWGASDAVKATAAMCIITSFFFLCDVIIYLWQRFGK